MSDSQVILAIDPGDEHVGTAWFREDTGLCYHVIELKPDTAVEVVKAQLGMETCAALVVEEFRLYPWKAQQQAFSQMLTAQLIGKIELCWQWWGKDLGVDLAYQGASIKEPTKQILRAKKFRSVAKQNRAGGHCADAELHGYHYIYNTLGRQWPSSSEQGASNG